MTRRIGVDATCWASARGYGRFAREVVRELVALAPTDEFCCFGDRRAFAAFPLEAPNLRRIEVGQRTSPVEAAAADGRRALADMLRLTRAVRRARPAVFFSPSAYAFFPLPPGLRAVVTVHDAIADRFPELTLPSRRARLFWRLKMHLALGQARLVLTVSDYAAAELERVLGVERARIRVALEAPASAYRPAPEGEVRGAAARAGVPAGAAWFTYAGGFNPHKRVDQVIRAHAAVARTRAAPPHLVLVGALRGDVFLNEVPVLRRLVQDLGTGALVHWTDYLPDPELAALHTGAVACLLPSESEGFGLPAVEAAACGTPVIATTESPLPGLLAGGGIFVRPGDPDRLAAAMRALLDDPATRGAMGAAARARAARLSWRETAGAVLAALDEAAP